MAMDVMVARVDSVLEALARLPDDGDISDISDSDEDGEEKVVNPPQDADTHSDSDGELNEPAPPIRAPTGPSPVPPPPLNEISASTPDRPQKQSEDEGRPLHMQLSVQEGKRPGTRCLSVKIADPLPPKPQLLTIPEGASPLWNNRHPIWSLNIFILYQNGACESFGKDKLGEMLFDIIESCPIQYVRVDAVVEVFADSRPIHFFAEAIATQKPTQKPNEEK